MRGWPKLGWTNGVRKVVNDKGLDVRKANVLVRKRSERRAIVHQD